MREKKRKVNHCVAVLYLVFCVKRGKGKCIIDLCALVEDGGLSDCITSVNRTSHTMLRLCISISISKSISISISMSI